MLMQEASKYWGVKRVDAQARALDKEQETRVADSSRPIFEGKGKGRAKRKRKASDGEAPLKTGGAAPVSKKHRAKVQRGHERIS